MANNVSTELKGLQSQLCQKQGVLKSLETKQKILSKETIEIKKTINHIKQKIENLKLKNKELIISEHALIRYIERVIGINIEKLKDDIINDQDKKHIKNFGDCKINKTGFKLIIKNNVVVTVE